MEITFAPSFFKSLKKLHMYDMWWYKIYSFFRYDIFRFFKNVWLFRKELYQFYSWDYHYTLQLFRKSLELTSNYLKKHGYEVETCRNKKISAINRSIELLDHQLNFDYIEQAEKQLGTELIHNDDWYLDASLEPEEQREHNKKIIDLAVKIEEDQWGELWSIIKGNYTFNKGDSWDEKFNGSDLRGWWD